MSKKKETKMNTQKGPPATTHADVAPPTENLSGVIAKIDTALKAVVGLADDTLIKVYLTRKEWESVRACIAR